MKKGNGLLRQEKNSILEKLMAENPITFFEVGAARGGKRFSDVSNFIEYYGFEPDEVEAKKLEQALTLNGQYRKVKIFPEAVMEKSGPVSINITKKLGCSSVLEPNTERIDGYSSRRKSLTPWPRFFDVFDTYDCHATPLDEIVEKNRIPRVDFLGLDTQGTELEIIRGGESIIKKTTLLLHIEMEIWPLYKDQPVMQDILSTMSDYGFRLIHIENEQNISRHPADRTDIIDRGELVSIDGFFGREIDEVFWNTLGKEEATILRYMLLLQSLHFFSLAIYIGRQHIVRWGSENSLIKQLVDELEASYIFENNESTPRKVRIKREVLRSMPRSLKDILKKIVY